VTKLDALEPTRQGVRRNFGIIGTNANQIINVFDMSVCLMST